MSEKKPCPDCGGKGYSYSDPDGKQLKCGMCNGYGKVEDKMSEKYSTEDFVLWITASCDINAVKSECDVSDACPECAKQRDAIIARLRSADKLCEVAKKVQKYFKVDYHLNILDKAIADYEGKEG